MVAVWENMQGRTVQMYRSKWVVGGVESRERYLTLDIKKK
jgi:hypothetical protein